jgi:hypothetical protein
VNDSTQHFAVTPASGLSRPGLLTAMVGQWFVATHRDGTGRMVPWTVAPEWAADVTVRLTSTVPAGFDERGEPRLEPRTSEVTATRTCTGAPLHVHPHKSRLVGG